MRLLTFYNSEVDPLPSAARAALVPARVLYPHLKCDYGDDDGDDDDDGGDVGFSPSWLTYFPAVFLIFIICWHCDLCGLCLMLVGMDAHP